MGQADGIACRTVEMFEAFGLANRLLSEAYQIKEDSFWRPNPQDSNRIKRARRTQDTKDGLSEFPHLIVNQVRMLAYLRDHRERSASKSTPVYGLHASDVRVADDGSSEYPVAVTVRHMKDRVQTGETSTIRAKYVVGCEGSHSVTRGAIGRKLGGSRGTCPGESATRRLTPKRTVFVTDPRVVPNYARSRLVRRPAPRSPARDRRRRAAGCGG